MIRKAFLIILFCHSLAFAQQNAFVLVDKSASSPNLVTVKQEARNLIHALLAGGYSNSDFPGWSKQNIQDTTLADALNGRAIAGNQSWICIMPFGEKNRYRDYQIFKTVNYTEDIQKAFAKWYPSSFTDAFTYMSIAEAYTARIATKNSIPEYYIFMVTDGMGDQDDTDSKNGYNSEENAIINEWQNPTTTIVSKVGVLEKSNYQIIIKKIINTALPQVPRNDQEEEGDSSHVPKSYDLRLTSFANGRLKDPVKIEKEDIAVSWACAECPEGTRYKVVVSAISGSKFREAPKKGLTGNSTTYRLPPGKYKITVSGETADNRGSVSPATTYIEVTADSTGFILIALAAIAVGVVATIYWSRHKKEQRKNQNHSHAGSGKSQGQSPRADTGDRISF